MRTVFLLLGLLGVAFGQDVAGLKVRSIGPALMSGRISTIAVHPRNPGLYYVGVASGGVWKTVNNGATWTPVFDKQGSYSIGYVTLDPRNPNTVWVGTGEDNSQRSVGYGDGVYRSDDGGATWKNLGLKKSEHLSKIVIDPKDSNVVYVAAQGPLWGPGGDRGLYKSVDGGKSWKASLTISENTGVTDVVMDPRNPNVLFAAAWQRRRHFYTLINGGPESALYKSVDAGVTWQKMTGNGLPAGELGRIGMAIAPSEPDVMYATIEATGRLSGLYRSEDAGANWTKVNDVLAQPMYYAKVYVDPKQANRIYIPDVMFRVSDDGGRNVRFLGEKNKHVDNHVIWIEPENTNHYLVGCDGGLYETWDKGANWIYKSNLPVTQFYDISVDDAKPFYNVYGGTQDNNSLAGPVRTKSGHGILNEDWYVTRGGDGFISKVDPFDPNLIYAESQNGGLSRVDKRTGEAFGIQPLEAPGEAPLRWNWDSPFTPSVHKAGRIYFGAQKIFRSDDRGGTWKAVSPDLTRALERNQLKVMGKVWGPEAIAKNQSTALYGNLSVIVESAKKDGLLLAGSDDGLIHVSENAGTDWRKVGPIAGAPENGYVKKLAASAHDVAVMYAAFDNHQNGDFKPYLFKSVDSGRTWTPIMGNLPENGAVKAFAEDPIQRDLLFAGTEFGAFFTNDGGKKWTPITGGMPVIPVHDIVIQKRENDLLLGTFGRGIYVLDDYSALRSLTGETQLYPVRDALLYLPTRKLGGAGKGTQGEMLYAAENPPFGAVFTYFLKDGLKSKRDARREAERKKDAAPVAYPALEALRAEAEEEPPAVVFTITDATGRAVRQVNGPVGKGFNRVAWDLREPAAVAARGDGLSEEAGGRPQPQGNLVMPGVYKVQMQTRVDGVLTAIGEARSFRVVSDGTNETEFRLLTEFQQKVSRLQKAVNATVDGMDGARAKAAALRSAAALTPGLPAKALQDLRAVEQKLSAMRRVVSGDAFAAGRYEGTPTSISGRVNAILFSSRGGTGRPLGSWVEGYAVAARELQREVEKLRVILDVDLKALDKTFDAAGAPATPGRLPAFPLQ